MAALTVLSYGIYVPIWFGFSWAELRRDTSDETMFPAAHGASIFIPGYGTWQAYRHFALIGALLAKIGAPLKVDPSTAALATTVWWVTWLHYSNEPLFVVLNVIELVAGTAVVVFGQRALNAYWAARPGPPADDRVLQTDWFALGMAAAFFVFITVSNALAPSDLPAPTN
ncbi:MAG: hypothetical protein E6H89_06130 [Chloroflexi bacterium]|nr:MAG: hypothetical protein E6H89_06130 [Chloroflexota bacterium]